MCNALNHAPECTCGFGGEGHLGTGSGTGSSSSHGGDGFCYPTSCQFCRQRVFFVKHNGGSVFFNDLGPPWPKHDCEGYRAKLSQIEQRGATALSLWMKRLKEPQVGLVTKAFVQQRSGEVMSILGISGPKGAFREIRLMANIPINAFNKELVVFSLSDKKLIRPYKNGELSYPIQIAPKLQVSPKTRWRRW